MIFATTRGLEKVKRGFEKVNGLIVNKLVRSCEVVEERITDTDTEGVRPSRPSEKSTRAYPLGLIMYKEG